MGWDWKRKVSNSAARPPCYTLMKSWEKRRKFDQFVNPCTGGGVPRVVSSEASFFQFLWVGFGLSPSVRVVTRLQRQKIYPSWLNQTKIFSFLGYGSKHNTWEPYESVKVSYSDFVWPESEVAFMFICLTFFDEKFRPVCYANYWGAQALIKAQIILCINLMHTFIHKCIIFRIWN